MNAKEKIERYDWNEQKEKPEIKWVEISKLNIDPSYQRTTLKEHTVLSIARDFDWNTFGSLMVMERCGQMFVIDGQHRLAAVKRRGDIPKVPVLISKSKGIKSEARAFFTANSGRVAVSAYNKYRAMVVAGDPDYVKCDKMLSEIGLRVSDQDGLDCIAFPSGLMRTYKINSEECKNCLLFQRNIIGREFLDYKIHKGLFEIVTRTKSRYLYSFQEKLKTEGGKSGILRAIKTMSIEMGQEVSPRVAAMGILTIVNSRLKNKIIIQWAGEKNE